MIKNMKESVVKLNVYDLFSADASQQFESDNKAGGLRGRKISREIDKMFNFRKVYMEMLGR